MFQSRGAPSRAEAKLIRALHRRKARDEEGLFLAEGIRVVEELVGSGIPVRLAVVSPSAEESERGAALVRALGERAPVRRVSDAEFARLAATEAPQGVLAVAEAPKRELHDITPPDAATVLVLDGIQDPGNFGTMVRTADAFGADLVAALPGTVDPWNPKAVRSSAGASFRVPIVQTEVDRLLGWLRGHGFVIYGAEAGGADVGTLRIARRAALVVGNEGAGLGPTVRGAADELVAIPIAAHAESLNVAVAAGILLYLFTRKR